MTEASERRAAFADLARRRGKIMARIMDWGDGSSNNPLWNDPKHAIRRIETLTRRYLVENNVTIEEARAWMRGYEEEAKEPTSNVSAGPRWQLMKCVVTLLESLDQESTGLGCCGQELTWRHSEQFITYLRDLERRQAHIYHDN